MENNSSMLKCIRSMYYHEGFLSYYKGLSSVLFSVPLVNALVFGSYEFYKKIFHPAEIDNKLSFYNGMMAGFFAGFVNCSLIGPIELVKCRLQMQKSSRMYNGSLDCLKKIYFNEGIKGVYRASVATQLREVPAYGAQFASYECFKDGCIKYLNNGKDITYLQTMIGGGISGVICWVASYPQDIIKTRLQCLTGDMRGLGLDGGFFREGKNIFRSEGVKGFWKGFSACLTRAFYANAIGFVAYEQSKKMLAQTSYYSNYVLEELHYY